MCSFLHVVYYVQKPIYVSSNFFQTLQSRYLISAVYMRDAGNCPNKTRMLVIAAYPSAQVSRCLMRFGTLSVVRAACEGFDWQVITSY